MLTREARQDELVIPVAARLHDIGYFGLFDGDSNNYQTVQDKKEYHMINGRKLAGAFVSQKEVSDVLIPEQRQRIVHLVGVHDKVAELNEIDEITLMMADTLGMIDVDRVPPTFGLKDRLRFIDELNSTRIPKFTELGKKYLDMLLPRFASYKN